eukprot:1549663-Prymnesium_polylepis.1
MAAPAFSSEKGRSTVQHPKTTSLTATVLLLFVETAPFSGIEHRARRPHLGDEKPRCPSQAGRFHLGALKPRAISGLGQICPSVAHRRPGAVPLQNPTLLCAGQGSGAAASADDAGALVAGLGSGQAQIDHVRLSAAQQAHGLRPRQQPGHGGAAPGLLDEAALAGGPACGRRRQRDAAAAAAGAAAGRRPEPAAAPAPAPRAAPAAAARRAGAGSAYAAWGGAA